MTIEPNHENSHCVSEVYFETRLKLWQNYDSGMPSYIGVNIQIFIYTDICIYIYIYIEY